HVQADQRQAGEEPAHREDRVDHRRDPDQKSQDKEWEREKEQKGSEPSNQELLTPGADLPSAHDSILDGDGARWLC
ncbi:MAG TPA: hypothetical protein VIJ61_10400, partial [Thermoanaerobaculia bacterium]